MKKTNTVAKWFWRGHAQKFYPAYIYEEAYHLSLGISSNHWRIFESGNYGRSERNCRLNEYFRLYADLDFGLKQHNQNITYCVLGWSTPLLIFIPLLRQEIIWAIIESSFIGFSPEVHLVFPLKFVCTRNHVSKREYLTIFV